MTSNSIQFQKGDKVGFVFDNHLATGIFMCYEMDNTEAIVSFNGQQLRFSDCSIYKMNNNNNNIQLNTSKQKKTWKPKNRNRINNLKR